ncbi:protein lethal(2)essential for life-like protein [Dinothrombium tinctorium]|uniref:Protein lethal(2)essential for life-like protein n=1 Tax=Dinothrombium tinctorium TaxID=1965070 RepID=A0A443QNI3_9ACAR|nr:protein lethal(2)essential for life-like protein [Dinothrombium tinctorium]
MAFRSLVLRPTNDYWDLFDFPQRIFDQRFGLGIADDDFTSALNSLYFRPRRHFLRQLSNQLSRGLETGVSEVRNEKDQFRVQLDVSHFAPEELTVKAVDGNCVVIEGKHEEKPDEHGFISRQFTRKYLLPRDVDAEKLVSSLTPEGMLVITAPKKALEAPKSNEKVIPITMGAAAQPAVQNAPESKEAEK